ncbi:hypothetical protein PG997_009809 [Apiospora hydei]|uniref:Protein kinase domain-containing protein n=1 Tax=Apiospora hydei TaxID=1337664 RepID=A0ABR1VV76_9PEZI
MAAATQNPGQPQPRIYPPLDLKQLIAGRPENVDRNEPKFILARTALKKVRSTFENTNLEYERVLGYGGFGVAVKYSQKNGTGQHLRHIVVKAPVRPDRPSTVESLIHEYTWYDFVKGMEHVPFLVNPVPLYRSPPPPPDSGQEPEHLGDRDFISAPGHFLITEFLDHGELIALVHRLNAAAMAQPNSDTSPKLTFIPNRLLWRIFLCLVRSAIAMAWPYAVASWRSDYMEDHKDDVPPVTIQDVDDMLVEEPYREDIWDGVKTENVVHFDIDLHNKSDRRPRDQMKSHEGAGKTPYMAPEQFLGMPDDLKMWDYRTNLWGIGLAMCSLMTKGRLSGDPQKKYCQDATFKYPDGTEMVVPQTYAWFLENEKTIRSTSGITILDRFDVDLRYTVATLMSRNLDVRGTLDLLLLNVTGQIDETDRKAQRGSSRSGRRMRPCIVSAAGVALEAPTPQPVPFVNRGPGALGAALQQFGNMNLGGGGAGP